MDTLSGLHDYYAILGVSPSAEDVVIRGAFRALILKYHPDTFQGDRAFAERKSKELNEAYSVLSDPEKRKAYDASRKKAASSSQRNSGPQPSRKQDDKPQNEPPKARSTSTGTKQSHGWSSETEQTNQRGSRRADAKPAARSWGVGRVGAVIMVLMAINVIATRNRTQPPPSRPAVEDWIAVQETPKQDTARVGPLEAAEERARTVAEERAWPEGLLEPGTINPYADQQIPPEERPRSVTCNRVETEVLRVICSTPSLVAADQKLASTYAGALAYSTERNKLREEQRLWLYLRDGALPQPYILEHLYSRRIEQLQTQHWDNFGRWYAKLKKGVPVEELRPKD